MQWVTERTDEFKDNINCRIKTIGHFCQKPCIIFNNINIVLLPVVREYIYSVLLNMEP